MKKYLRLFRVKHYIKNIFIFTTLIFGGQVLTSDFYKVLIGFFAFCLTSSSIYIMNDLVDYKIDRKTKSKKNEPIASNMISKKKGVFLAILLWLLALGINFFTFSPISYLYIIGYFILNLFYSFIGKNIPYLEWIIMVMFYLLRVLFGSAILNVEVSLILILTVIFGASYIILMKRMIELRNKKYRKVLQYYTEKQLRILSLVCLGFMLICYIYWVFKQELDLLMITIVLVILIFARYEKKVVATVDGNPVEVLFQDRLLFIFSTLYIVLCTVLFEIC